MRNYTCSSIFLLPQLRIDKRNLRDNNLGFIDSYLCDKNKTRLTNERILYVVFKPKDHETFNYFLELEKERIDIIEDYDYSGGYVVVVYKLPSKFKLDYIKFDEGKYSKFSKEFKSAYNESMRAHDIINKTENMYAYWSDRLDFDFKADSSLELWSKPDLEQETLDIEKIMEYEDKQ